MALAVQSLVGGTQSVFPNIHMQPAKSEVPNYYMLAELRVLQAEKRAIKAEFRAIKAEADRKVLEAENRALLAESRLRNAQAMLSHAHPNIMDYNTSESITRMDWKKRKKKKRYRFPWLQMQAVAVGDDVFNHIMTFVEEGAMFKFREVNRACYHLFYSRKDYTDVKRVMKLAGMGRQFSKLKTLSLPKLTTEELCCITQLQFPRLETISMPHVEAHEMRFFPAHGTATTLSDVSSAHSITEHRFPSLVVVKVNKPKNERLRVLHPHSKIEILDLSCDIDEQGYALISREKFPSLRLLQLYRWRELGRESAAWKDFKARLVASSIVLRL